MLKRIGNLLIIIIFISNLVVPLNALETDYSLHYKSFRNQLADLMGGTTVVKVIKNKNGEKEFVIENEKHHAVMLEFSDSEAKIFAEYVAMPNTATILDKSLELLETPLKVDYKSYLDGTFLSSMTHTGLLEKNLPKSGSIRVYLGNKKAMVSTAIGIFSSSLDFTLSYAELASGKEVRGLKKYLQYTFFYNAIRNPELMNSCTNILINLSSNPSTKQIETALIQIKDEYMKYLEGNLKEILNKALYSILDFKMTESFERSLKLTLAQVKNLSIIEKFGKNILVPISALVSEIQKGERTIGWQFFYDGNGTNYPKVAKDIPLSYELNKKLLFLKKYDVSTVYKLYSKNGNYNTFNAEASIRTKYFINMIIEAYNRTHLYGTKLSADIFFPLSDKLYKSGSSTEFQEKILLKDTIAVMYYLFEHSYGDRFTKGKIYKRGTMRRLSFLLFRHYIKEYYRDIKNKYPEFYLAKTRKMYMIYGSVLFKDSSELNSVLTKAKAVRLVYDYMKYNSIRDKGE